MSSRLAFDSQGRLIAIETDGTRWLVLGNLVKSTITGDTILFGWLGRSGRPPTARERATAREPYLGPGRTNVWPRRRDRDDDDLDASNAIAAAYAEQRREPADLIHGRAAWIRLRPMTGLT
jgi:hypothetical protein